MTATDATAARYFPFRTGPDTDRVIRNAPNTDREAQTRAARRSSTNRNAVLAARPLWYSPVLVIFTVGTRYWWVSVVAVAICVAAGCVLYRIAGNTRDEARLADATIGIPLPDDIVDEVMNTGTAMRELDHLFDLAEQDDEVYERVRRHKRRIYDIDQLHVRHLHLARRQWVASDWEQWRRTARQLPIIAERARDLAEQIRS